MELTLEQLLEIREQATAKFLLIYPNPPQHILNAHIRMAIENAKRLAAEENK
jgi:hypothetical protein